jgi:hypothetical protein
MAKLSPKLSVNRLEKYRASLTDEFGLMVGKGLTMGGYHTFSENSQSSAHASHDKPFPGWLVTALRKGDMPATDMTISKPILETTPEVFGSYDKQINMFMSDGKWTSSGGPLCRETPN